MSPARASLEPDGQKVFEVVNAGGVVVVDPDLPGVVEEVERGGVEVCVELPERRFRDGAGGTLVVVEEVIFFFVVDGGVVEPGVLCGCVPGDGGVDVPGVVLPGVGGVFVPGVFVPGVFLPGVVVPPELGWPEPPPPVPPLWDWCEGGFEVGGVEVPGLGL